MKNMSWRKYLVLVLLLGIAGYNAWENRAGNALAGDNALQAAFEQQLSDQQVEASGTVDRVLPDDTHGSRHQRFIVRMPSGLTVLVAHNIDLAPRVEGLREGDAVSFYGEYEWTERGGTVHWTHHDPGGRHVDGWIRHQGKTYQ